MLLKIDGLEFDIDLDRTMMLRAAEAEDPCDCAYCRNFTATVDRHYPNLRPLLAQFGVDILVPDESMPFDQPNEMWYENIYSVCGHIINGDEATLVIDGTEVYIYSDNKLHVNPVCCKPCFFLGVGMMRLPWVLDEPMREVRSPANQPSFLQKMWKWLLGKADKTETIS